MSSVVISGDTSGAITLSAPAVAGTNTITLPASTGTVALTSQINGPAFSATRTATTQSISSGVVTKAQFTEETFDTNNCYDSSTNYRFTPTVAGYYQVNWSIVIDVLSASTEFYAAVFKNGVNYSWSSNLTATAAHYNAVSGSDLVYLNGSTDYIEIYVQQNGGSSKSIFIGGATFPSRFSASMVRAA